ncbi:caspase domain-containing protein [Chitinophaga filiformis]|uniref:Caspase family protein n=1 Tax=Chitinophaga filiformis TaxID=104663 RepID=A0ABY4I5S2_CHIFI|nr:caspase family protein [Chitinophaga filiformis]UPK71187.1 caspase family protein [Chitinophaga filiformis]
MRKALVVGIDEYPGSAKLKGCVNDAMEVARLLDTNADGSPNFDVMVSNNVKTRSVLKSLIADLFKSDDEIGLFYFSGHGYFTDIGGYIVTPDFSRYDEGISMDEILKIVSRSNARHKIVILDCCHAGAMGTTTVTGTNTAFLKEGVIILASSRDTEVSVEKSGQGVFTRLLVDALKGGAADIGGEVTPGNIYSYIDKALGRWEQRPVFKANIAHTVSLRKVKPVVALSELRKLTEYFQHADSEYPLDPSYEYTAEAPDSDNINIFKILRRMQLIGLVEPVGEEYMYWAAINRKSCRLTSMGMYYWKLLTNKRI